MKFVTKVALLIVATMFAAEVKVQPVVLPDAVAPRPFVAPIEGVKIAAPVKDDFMKMPIAEPIENVPVVVYDKAEHWKLRHLLVSQDRVGELPTYDVPVVFYESTEHWKILNYLITKIKIAEMLISEAPLEEASQDKVEEVSQIQVVKFPTFDTPGKEVSKIKVADFPVVYSPVEEATQARVGEFHGKFNALAEEITQEKYAEFPVFDNLEELDLGQAPELLELEDILKKWFLLNEEHGVTEEQEIFVEDNPPPLCAEAEVAQENVSWDMAKEPQGNAM